MYDDSLLRITMRLLSCVVTVLHLKGTAHQRFDFESEPNNTHPHYLTMFVNWDIDLCLNFKSCVQDSQYMYKPTTNLRVSGTIYKNDKISCNWHRFTAEICPNMLWHTLRKFLVWNINHDLTDYHTDFKPVTLSLLLYTRSTLHSPELRYISNNHGCVL